MPSKVRAEPPPPRLLPPAISDGDGARKLGGVSVLARLLTTWQLGSRHAARGQEV